MRKNGALYHVHGKDSRPERGMCGYNEEISLEMEDLTLSVLEGHLASLWTLKAALATP